MFGDLWRNYSLLHMRRIFACFCALEYQWREYEMQVQINLQLHHNVALFFL